MPQKAKNHFKEEYPSQPSIKQVQKQAKKRIKKLGVTPE